MTHGADLPGYFFRAIILSDLTSEGASDDQ
jgi:hypothetical protein